MTKTPAPMAITTARGRDGRHALPPLQWWRGEAPEQLDHAAAAARRKTRWHLSVLGRPHLQAALQGEASPAVGAALATASRPDVPDWPVDGADAALLLCTLEGSPAAALALAPRHHRLAVSAPSASNRGA